MPVPTLLPNIEWQSVFESAWDYSAWRSKGQARVDSDFLATFPEDKIEKVREFLADNRANMDETDASYQLDADTESCLAALGRTVNVLCIAEDWCPDVVRHVPILQKMADSSEKINVRYVMRSDQLEIFSRYLTAGGEAVPKFIFLSQEFVECGAWGPMPTACRRLIARGRACGDIAAARESVSALYKSDVDRHIVVEELMYEIDTASCAAP
ncbi:MAG: thioredoxin family protein [Candidatus Hydrogenedentota bacterium]